MILSGRKVFTVAARTALLYD